MNYYRWLFLAMFAVTTSTQAFQSNEIIFEQFDDIRMVASISQKDIDNSPEWNPDMEMPPLTVSQAIKAVKDFTKSSDNAGIVKEIEIRPFPKHVKHWHYLIKVTNKAKKARYDIYVVLMNGKVIPAIIEPQTYK